MREHLNLNNDTFSFNTANSIGGAITNIGILNVTGGIFNNNTATSNGGAIWDSDISWFF